MLNTRDLVSRFDSRVIRNVNGNNYPIITYYDPT